MMRVDGGPSIGCLCGRHEEHFTCWFRLQHFHPDNVLVFPCRFSSFVAIDFQGVVRMKREKSCNNN